MQPPKYDTAWERLHYMVSTTRHNSVAEFSRSLGYKSGSVFYSAHKKGYFPQAVVRRIHEKYPCFLPEWICGENDNPLNYCKRTSETTGLQLASIGIYRNLALYEPEQNPRPDCVIYLSEVLCGGAQFASFYQGETLSPRIPAGSVVLLRTCSVEKIDYRGMYYVVTRTSRSWRIIRPGKDAAHIILTTHRPKVYPKRQIHRQEIKALYKIQGYIAINDML